MKKLLAIILTAVMLLSMAGCGYNTTTNPNTNTGNNIDDSDMTVDVPHTKHEGNGTCTVCGINYYDELVSYIKNNGTRNSDGNYEIRKEENTEYKPDRYHFEYLDDENKISLRVMYCLHNGKYYKSFIMIIDPVAVKYHEYHWNSYADYYQGTPGEGVLEPETISPATDIVLDISNFTSNLDSDKSYSRARASEWLYILINDILIPAINGIGKNITPADFGFERFE